MKWTDKAEPTISADSTVILYPGSMPVPTATDKGPDDLRAPQPVPRARGSELSLAGVTEGFAAAQRSFIDEGIQFVSLMARLNSLREATRLQQADAQVLASPAPKPLAPDTGAAAQPTAAPEEEPRILNRMHKADILWREQSAAENHTADLPPCQQSGQIARLKTRTQALDRLTQSMRQRVLEMQSEIGNLAAGLFERRATASVGAGLRTLEMNARLDIAARLLADGMSETLVAQLSRLDADVILALSADID